MVKDPKQFTNQASNPEYSVVLKKLQEQLDLRLKEEGIELDSNGKKYIQKEL